MLSERQKKTIILTLALSALVIDVVATLTGPAVVPLARRASTLLFHTTRLLILCCFVYGAGGGVAAITATLVWRPGGRVLRVFLILVSVTAVAYAFFWLVGIYGIAHLKP